MAYSSDQERRDEQIAITSAVVSAVVERQREVSEIRWRVFGGVVIRLLLLALCGYVLWRVHTIVTTLIIAGVLAIAASALVEPLMRVPVPFLSPKQKRLAATSLVFVALFGSLFLMTVVFIRPFQTEWAELYKSWPRYQMSLQTWAVQAKAWFEGLPPDVQSFLNGLREKQPIPSPTAWLGNLVGTTVSWASHVVELILVPVLAFYFVVDGRALRSELLFFVPKGRLRSTMAILNESGTIMRNYIIAQVWLAVIAGVLVGGVLAAFHVPYALILGVIAGVTRAIPVIGPLLGGIPVVLIAFLTGAQQGNPFLWMQIALFFTVLHLVESKVLMPKILGKHLNLHAVVILIALLVGGEFFGLMGMFLAVPVVALARVLLMHFFILPRQRKERALRAAKLTLEKTPEAEGNRKSSPLRLTTIEVSGGVRSTGRLERALQADREARRTSSGDAA